MSKYIWTLPYIGEGIMAMSKASTKRSFRSR